MNSGKQIGKKDEPIIVAYVTTRNYKRENMSNRNRNNMNT